MNCSIKIVYTKEVKDAIDNHLPVVALESTIISHGMPYPKNIECALMLEDAVRKEGVVPATISIINGEIHVGLTRDELEEIGDKKKDIVKVSKRDLPVVVARKLSGATTVAATAYIASLSGIKVFATGGIGGVHRGYKDVLDISNDLDTLGEEKVIVVCAGCKSILDIPNTLEYLETKGVPVIGYKTLECPAFYSRESGISLEYRSDSPKDIADIANAKWNLGLNGGVLIFNPIDPKYSMKKEEIDKEIEKALEDAKNENITGKRITPYLLSKLVDLTDGKSLDANIELVKSNAKLAALIAKEL